MARHDDGQKQLRRTLDDLGRGFDRKDFDRVIEAFVQLPPVHRGPQLSRVAAMFRDEIFKRHPRAPWSELHRLASRIDAAPEVLTYAATDDQTAAAVWPLVWAAGIAKDLPRAERLMAHLHPWLNAQAPELSRVLTRWVVQKGSITTDDLGGLTVATDDPRLGMESSRPRANVPAPPAPTRVEDVLGAAAALFAHCPWPTVIHAVTVDWPKGASADVVAALRREVVGLCLHDALRRKIDRASEPLRTVSLAARCLSEIVDKASVREDAITLMWLVVDAVASRVSSAVDVASRALPEVARDAALASTVVDVVCGLPDDTFKFDGHISFLGGLWQHIKDARLMIRALDRWNTEHDLECDHDPPDWIFDAMQVDATSQAVTSILLRTSTREGSMLLGWVLELCEADALDKVVDAVWDRADEVLQERLAEAVAFALMSGSAAVRMADDPFSMADRRHPDRLDPKEAARTLARIEKHMSRMLPRSPVFLLMAMTSAASAEKARAVVGRFFESGGRIQIALQAADMSAHDRPESHTQLLGDEILQRIEGDFARLCAGFRWLEVNGTSIRFRRLFAGSLVRASALHPAPWSDLDAETIAVAQKWLGVRARKAKKPTTKKPTAKKPAAEKPAAKKRAAKKPAAKKPTVSEEPGDGT